MVAEMLQKLKTGEVESVHFASISNVPEMRADIEGEAERIGLGIIVFDSTLGYPSNSDALAVFRFDDYAVAYGLPR